MRLPALIVLLSVLVCVWAWDKADYEIFDLVGALEEAEGKGTTFYSWLGVQSSATSAEISRAYRKKSIKMHPDKNPNVKNVHKRFARLGTIAQILRDPQGRERYDFFYKNGVPKWRGTGYYYSRYRPGLGSVLSFLIILTSALQYVIQKMNYKKDIERVNKFISSARTAAWGPKMIPLGGPRKVKVNMGGPVYMDDEGRAVGSKTLDMVVDGKEVFLVEPDGALLHLDHSAATPPSVVSTWFIALIRLLVDRLRGKGAAPEPQESQPTSSSDSTDSEVGTNGSASRPSRLAKPSNGRRRQKNRKRD